MSNSRGALGKLRSVITMLIVLSADTVAIANARRVRLRTSMSRLKTAPNVTVVTAGKPTASFTAGACGNESAYCRIAVDAVNPRLPHTLSTCFEAPAAGRYSAGSSPPAMASRSAARRLSTGARSNKSPPGNTSTPRCAQSRSSGLLVTSTSVGRAGRQWPVATWSPRQGDGPPRTSAEMKMVSLRLPTGVKIQVVEGRQPRQHRWWGRAAPGILCLPPPDARISFGSSGRMGSPPAPPSRGRATDQRCRGGVWPGGGFGPALTRTPVEKPPMYCVELLISHR